MSEVEMLGIGGVVILGLFLVARAILGVSRKSDESDLVRADGGPAGPVDAGGSDD